MSGREPVSVLHLASGDSWGGAERVLSVLVHEMLEREELALEVLLLNEGELSEGLRGDGASVDVLPESGRSFVQLLRDVRRYVGRREIDVIHAHRYKEILLAVYATLGRSRPRAVATIHGLEPLSTMPWKARILIVFALFLGRFAGVRYAAVSQEIVDRLTALLRSAGVRRIGNPMVPPKRGDVPVAVRELVGWPERPLVGFVGRLEPVKGPDLFFDIAEADRSGAGFLVLGAGSMDEELRARAGGAALAERLVLLGEVPNVFDYMSELSILALTSRHEGIPMVLLEAATSELPVVVFDVGGVREVLEGAPAEWVVPAGDVAAFGLAIEGILADPAAAREQAREWAGHVRDRYSVKTVLDAYVELYRSGEVESAG